MPQLLLDNQRQAVGLLSEIDGLSIQINLRQIPGGAKIPVARHNCLSTAPSNSTLPACRPVIETPPGNNTVKPSDDFDSVAETTATLANPDGTDCIGAVTGSVTFLRQ